MTFPSGLLYPGSLPAPARTLLPLVHGAGKSITVVTRTVTGRDALGNDIYTETSTQVDGCVVYPRGSTELVQGQDLVTDSLTALLPPGTAITATDRVIVDGVTYEVDGQPSAWSNPFVSVADSLQVQLKVVTG